MTKNEFLDQRAALAQEAEAALNDGKAKEARALNERIRALYEEFRAEAVAAADRRAMNGEIPAVADFRNMSRTISGGKVIDIMNEQNNTPIIASEEYRNAYLAKLQGKQLDNTAMQMVVTAGAAVPTETVRKIWSFIQEDALLSRLTILHIPGNVTVPVESSIADAAWVAMGSADTADADALTGVSLAAYKLIKTVEIGADVKAMAIPEFEQYLVTMLGKKLRRALAAAALVGTGTAQPTGILTAVTQTGTYTKAGMTYKNLLAILASLGADYAEGACLIMSRALFLSDIMGMVDTQGRPVVQLNPQDPAKQTVLGYDVILTDGAGSANADKVVFGNPANFIFNIGKDIEIKASEDAGFLTGSEVWRGMCLADGKVASANAFKVFGRAAS